MSQYPWPEDIYAVARLDWCRSMDTPEGGSVAQLMCNNLARQCGSFTNATHDRQRIARTAPQLQELLKAAEIDSWSGKCPKVQAQGVCNLGGARAYEKELWGAFAQPRQNAAYKRIGQEALGPTQLESQEYTSPEERLSVDEVLLIPERHGGLGGKGLLASERQVATTLSASQALPFL